MRRRLLDVLGRRITASCAEKNVDRRAIWNLASQRRPAVNASFNTTTDRLVLPLLLKARKDGTEPHSVRYFFSKMSKEQRSEPKQSAADATSPPNAQHQQAGNINTDSPADTMRRGPSNIDDATAGQQAAESAQQQQPDAELHALKKQFDTEKQELNKKLADVVDRYKRALAETENVRTRLTKQASDARIYGIQSFCKDLLDVSDVMQKAVQSLPENSKSDKTVQLVVEGLRATEAQLQQVFHRHGLVKVNPMNEKFDPNLHEAVFQLPAQEGQENGQVVVVEKVGYKLNDRCLRPALVGVAKA